MDFKGTNQVEATDLDCQRLPMAAEIIANASLKNTVLSECNKNEMFVGEESVDFRSPISIAQHDKTSECDHVAVHKSYAVSSQITSLGTNGEGLLSNGCLEEKDTTAFSYMGNDFESGRIPGCHNRVPVLQQRGVDAEQEESLDSRSVNDTSEQRLVTMFDILLWLRNNHRASIPHVLAAFGYCETKHLLFLILEMLESSIIVEQEGVLRIASEPCSSRLEEATRSSQALFNLAINKRMHRALCLKAVVLNVVIHKPKMNVEFTIRHVKPDVESPVYYVQICKCPSCTCPDFVTGLKAELDYLPCKHLFYVYLVQLHIGKDHEHLMLQRSLEEEDLEKILDGHY